MIAALFKTHSCTEFHGVKFYLAFALLIPFMKINGCLHHLKAHIFTL